MKNIFLLLLFAELTSCGSLPHRGNNDAAAAQAASAEMIQKEDAEASARQAIYAQVKKPDTPTALLENMKFAMGHHLLLNEDFYTEENLKRISGGTSATRSVIANPNVQIWIVGGLESLFSPELMAHDKTQFQGAESRFWERTDDGPMQASWSLLFDSNDGHLNFKDVENIFGNNWKEAIELLTMHSIAKPAATKPYGNSHIIYDNGGQHPSQSLELEFKPDASLNKIILFEKK